MAHTRHGSRVSDTASAPRHGRAAGARLSPAADAPGASAKTRGSEIVEIAEGADESSPNPESYLSRSTGAFCKNCGSQIGDFYNSWRRVDRTLHLPALAGSYTTRGLKVCARGEKSLLNGDLKGCTLQPLACPGPATDCALQPLGFIVVDAPAEKRAFRGRELFNLSRIELRCNISPSNSIAVEPQETALLDLQLGEDSIPSSSAAMEIDSKPLPAQHPGPQSSHHHEQHHDHLHHHHQHQHQQPFHPSDANRQSLPSISAMRSPPNIAPLHTVPQKPYANMLPSISPALKSAHEASRDNQSYSSEATADVAKDQASRARAVEEQPYSNGYHHSHPPQETHPDAGERMQVQSSQNPNAIPPQSRLPEEFEERIRQVETNLRREYQAHLQRQDSDIRVLGEAVAGLHQDTHNLRQSMDTVVRDMRKTRSELRARGFNGAPGPAGSAPPAQGGSQDAALELMAQQVAVITQKAAEMDMIKLTIEIMKGKIHRLENEPPQHAVVAYQPPAQPTQSAPQVTQGAVLQTHSHGPPMHSQNHHAHEGPASASTQDLAQRPAPEQHQNSWATVNAGIKRNHQDGMESPRVDATPSFGSPKRQKLANVDTQSVYDASQTPSRIHTPTQTLPSQPHPMSESGPGPQSQQHPVYIPYGTQEGPTGEGWRPESDRMIQQRPLRGRGSRGGRGPGSRGGRVRKSLPASTRPPGTPDWEKDSWQGMHDGQTPTGYYSQTPNPTRTISRRGGSSMRGGYSPNDRAASLGLHNGSMGVDSPPLDQYGQPKKSRSKPVRNADGVLIRKDGRPDMRSQSSAANLRKVHARKDEQQKDEESGFTPTNRQYTTSAATNTPSPSRQMEASSDPNVSSSVQKKHNNILGRMFPNGIDASRRDNDYAHQVFNEDQDHTAHPRRRSHHTSQQSMGKRSLPIKTEHYDETPDAASQRSNSDVDMDRAEGPTDDEARTPPESQDDASEGENHYTDKVDTPAQPEQPEQSVQQEHETHNTEMQNGESTVTAAAEAPQET